MKTLIAFIFLLLTSSAWAATIGGVVSAENGEAVGFATVVLAGTNYGGVSDDQGNYSFSAPKGSYKMVVKVVGFQAFETIVNIDGDTKQDVVMTTDVKEVDEVTVVGGGVSRVQRSAFNAVALETKGMLNSTKNLSEVLTAMPGMRLRESGGVGSEMQLMLDGFSGNQVKIFIDGVPQEGVGKSFSINNIPVNFAERIEVYKGVVPVGFGTDAIGGVINIVTNRQPRRWFVDASYSYGSFNTHRWYVHAGQTLKSGFFYDLNVFQNYSDNNYKTDVTGVKYFLDGGVTRINQKETLTIRRFHDTFHNEAAVLKAGFVDKKWADKFAVGVTYARNYQEIQTDARQTTAYGGKYRKGHSWMPSVEFRKRNLLSGRLDAILTANYNHNITNNVDTSAYEFNWLGDVRYTGTLGELSYQDTRSKNKNFNASVTFNFRFNEHNALVINYVGNNFSRTNRSIEYKISDTIPKITHKNIVGVQYRFVPGERWNLTAFGKFYNQYASGPKSAYNGSTTEYVTVDNTTNALGYGAAATYFVVEPLQVKISYELAFRLPSNDELFGDEDLEQGDAALDPERSHNVNLNVSYDKHFGRLHAVYAEAGLIFRYTKDYIQRTPENVSGTYYGTYANHGKVKTTGFNVAAHYSFSRWARVGGTYTCMKILDDEELAEVGSSQKSLTYGSRMPNVPYKFANCDATFFWRDLGGKGNSLTATYDNTYVHEFPLYSEAYGSTSTKMVVPTQFSHNVSVAYSMRHGRYNVAVECKNFTDEKLYDNFSLQKAGRAFYGKIRLQLGNAHNVHRARSHRLSSN